MNPVRNWREIIKKAWSFRLLVLSAVLSGMEVALPIMREMLEPLQIVPTGAFAALAFLTTAAAGIARIVAQPKAKL